MSLIRLEGGLGPIPPGNLGFDPFNASIWVGMVAVVLAAILLRSTWSRQTKTWVTIALVVVLTVFVWWTSAYPASWQLLAAIFAQIYAASQIVYLALKPTGILQYLEEWTTPAATRHTPQHAATVDESAPHIPYIDN